MVDYSRQIERFFYRGMVLQPQDAIPEGKIGYGQNIRSYQDGTISIRFGLVEDTYGPLAVDVPIHSIFRLSDTTPFSITGAPSRRFVGAGPTLYAGTPGTGIPAHPATNIAATPNVQRATFDDLTGSSACLM